MKKVKVEVKLTGADGDVQRQRGGEGQQLRSTTKQQRAGGKVMEAEERLRERTYIYIYIYFLQNNCGERFCAESSSFWVGKNKWEWVKVRQCRHNRLDLFHRKTGERKIDSERSVCVCVVLFVSNVYSPLCLNCSTCVIKTNLARGNRRSLGVQMHYAHRRGGKKQKCSSTHLARVAPPTQLAASCDLFLQTTPSPVGQRASPAWSAARSLLTF